MSTAADCVRKPNQSKPSSAVRRRVCEGFVKQWAGPGRSPSDPAASELPIQSYTSTYRNHLPVPTIATKGSVELKVYPSEPMRHIPHFHVWIGGQSVASVSLVTFNPIVGGPLSRQVRRLIAEHADDLADAWEALHG